MQVEPVKWPDERMRKVLNNAILSGLVADEMITAAEQALTDGFEGSLSRYAACQCVPPQFSARYHLLFCLSSRRCCSDM